MFGAEEPPIQVVEDPWETSRSVLLHTARRFDDLQQELLKATVLFAPIPQHKGLQLWSPAMMANLYHFRFLQTIKRSVKPKKRPDMPKLLAKLQQQLESLNRHDTKKILLATADMLTINDFRISSWAQVTLSECHNLAQQHVRIITLKVVATNSIYMVSFEKRTND